MALSVPLSRFTSQVGGGSAFFVRCHSHIYFMSLLDIARDTLKDLPVSDIVRERLSLAFDRLAEAEAKIDALQLQNGSFQAQLERERLDNKQTRDELQRLKDEHAEDVRFHQTIEFRGGKRTGGNWMPFCPKCHLPALNDHNINDYVFCTACDWTSYVQVHNLQDIISRF